MRRPAYCCDDDKRAFEDYYCRQSGNGMPVFSGSRAQRGHGIGSVFSGLFRSVLPLIKKFAPIVGRKALETGATILGDMSAGKSIKEAAKERVTGAFQDGIKGLFQQNDNQTGSGKRTKRKKNSKKKQSTSKRSKRDIFS